MAFTRERGKLIFFPHFRFNAALQQAEERARKSSLEEQKDTYAGLCSSYLSLSSRLQTRFSPRIQVLREQIETHLTARVRVELLLESFGSGTIEDQREKYDELHLYFRTLPSDLQKHFYTEIVLVRNRLERGL